MERRHLTSKPAESDDAESDTESHASHGSFSTCHDMQASASTSIGWSLRPAIAARLSADQPPTDAVPGRDTRATPNAPTAAVAVGQLPRSIAEEPGATFWSQLRAMLGGDFPSLTLNTPELCIFGSQNVGKSATLIHLLGGNHRLFPSDGSGLCTKCPIEVSTIHSPELAEPEGDLHHPGRAPLHNLDVPTLRAAIEASMRELGGTEISTTPLRVEFRAPDVVDLTITDLPGHIVKSIGMANEVAARVRQLLLDKARNRNAINIAVFSGAGNDIENQPIFELLEEADPDHERTLGVLTHLDQPTVAFDSWVAKGLLLNKICRFGWGWVGLSHLHAATAEEQLAWSAPLMERLSGQPIGILALRAKLFDAFESTAARAMPALRQQVSDELSKSRAALTELAPTVLPSTELLIEVCRSYAQALKVLCGVERADPGVTGGGISSSSAGSTVDEARFDTQLLQKLRTTVDEHRRSVEAQLEAMSAQELREEQEAKGYGGWARDLDTGDLPMVRRVYQSLQQFDQSVIEPMADDVQRRLLDTIDRISAVSVRRELCASSCESSTDEADGHYISLPLPDNLRRQMRQIAASAIDKGKTNAKRFFRGQVEAFALYPETSDPDYIGKPSNWATLQARVRARGIEHAELTLRRDTCSPFAKALLRLSRSHLEKGVIDSNDFRLRQVVLAELGEENADGAEGAAAVDELWGLFLLFEDTRASKTRSAFFDAVYSVRIVDHRWLRRPFGGPASRPRRLTISSTGRLEVLPLASQGAGKPEYTVDNLQASGVVISRELGERGGSVRVSVPGQADLLIQPHESAGLVEQRVGRSERLGELALTSSAKGHAPAASGVIEEPWMLVADQSLFHFAHENIYRALKYACDGFRAHTPTLDARQTPALAELQEADRAEAYRQRVLDLHHRAHEQLVKGAPRGFAYNFLHVVVQEELPTRLFQWAKDASDPADFLSDKHAARRRAQRDELVSRVERLAAVEEALCCRE